MKLTIIIFSLFILSCSSTIKKVETHESTAVVIEKIITNDKVLLQTKFTFEKTQDSLRTLLLNTKPNESLKSSMLQELYIRNLVDQKNDKIIFKLPFNLHGFDCGAPDCYSTDITFEITANDPIEFPKTINFTLLEHGCGFEREIMVKDTFEIVEQSPEYVNYYAKKLQSNLVILGKKRALYYFPETKPNAIKVATINEIFKEYDAADINTIVPYQSTMMTTNEYEHFIEND